MLDNAVLVSAVQQSESTVCIHIPPLFFGFPPHLGHHRALNRLSCPVLYNRFSLVIYFIRSGTYMPIAWVFNEVKGIT